MAQPFACWSHAVLSYTSHEELKKKRKKENPESIFKPEIFLGNLLGFRITPQAYKLDLSGSRLLLDM